jgi:hypothetical protein
MWLNYPVPCMKSEAGRFPAVYVTSKLIMFIQRFRAYNHSIDKVRNIVLENIGCRSLQYLQRKLLDLISTVGEIL